MRKPQLILFYNTEWNMPLSYPDEDIPKGFTLTTDRRFMHDAIAVVFHIPSIDPKLFRSNSPVFPFFSRDKWIWKKKGQIWIAWSKECEVNHPQLSDPNFMKYFDLTMTYHLNSDIFVPYIYNSYKDLLRRPVKEKEPGKEVCAFISSSSHKSGRLEYLKRLMKCLDIHSYGKVLQNKILEEDQGQKTKLATISDYKFTIAFENAVGRDYVTEKFFEPLLTGSVPIYLGAPNIEDFTPGDNCYINVSDWDSPESLAEYILKISRDEAQYRKFFEWKSKPFREKFQGLLEQQREHEFVRLCKKIQDFQ